MFSINPKRSFPSSFFSCKSTFIPEQQQQEVTGGSMVDDDTPYQQEKKAIIETRAVLKEKTKEQREKVIPGMKLLKKIHKEQHKQRQMEESLTRVVKHLSI